ncbi:YlmC/YmxH family sporulation protein [Tissierella creatinophila]|uniref:PRC-barrel domain protein n=1 Tax=Tissierella creatinophila DSM 6911 TaxID=1123403 RepID=A0A1U7M380_TISCR|nr:YlmC/YmxH family sporulation protein [Tissierella creatinophila]OLS01772.1 PRC-barrel domain protein [Tissierella creatinophila DSM 6911]
MRLSELGQKEIVNLNNGERLGLISDADILFDKETGEIISLLASEKKISFKFLGVEGLEKEIPWDSIRKIGYDMIIVEL